MKKKDETEHNMSTHVHTQGHTHSYDQLKPELQMRLKRIEGQVRGIQKMIEEDRYCMDILVQIPAIRNALQNVALPLLESHTRGCEVDAIANKDGEQEKILELMDLFRQFSKM